MDIILIIAYIICIAVTIFVIVKFCQMTSYVKRIAEKLERLPDRPELKVVFEQRQDSPFGEISDPEPTKKVYSEEAYAHLSAADAKILKTFHNSGLISARAIAMQTLGLSITEADAHIQKLINTVK